MTYIIYKTTNTINGKYYIGAHNGKNKSYKGSGRVLKNAMKEYGSKNFVRELLEVCATEEEMYDREAAIVNDAIVADRNSYNIANGGRGGQGTPKSEEHKQKIRDNHLRKSNPGAGRPPLMNQDELVALCDKLGKRKASEVLEISIDACRSRYYRGKK